MGEGGVGAARPLAINREAGNCAHLQPPANPPQARLHCALNFSTICTILHFSQECAVGRSCIIAVQWWLGAQCTLLELYWPLLLTSEGAAPV